MKSDIADVAKRHGFDLGSAQGRSSAAERVDRFYERAAELIQSARSIELTRVPDPLVEALGSLAKVYASQGSVAFRNENQARARGRNEGTLRGDGVERHGRWPDRAHLPRMCRTRPFGRRWPLPSSRRPKNILRLVSARMKPRQRNAEW